MHSTVTSNIDWYNMCWNYCFNSTDLFIMQTHVHGHLDGIHCQPSSVTQCPSVCIEQIICQQCCLFNVYVTHFYYQKTGNLLTDWRHMHKRVLNLYYVERKFESIVIFPVNGVPCKQIFTSYKIIKVVTNMWTDDTQT